MRDKRLDILRCVAVLLVIFHHGHFSGFLTRAGWIGVDLFFVLSGFLISGLLYAEYKKTGTINFKRFFIRRGLKIYPAFYAFTLLTTIVGLGMHQHAAPIRYVHEVLFVQNYLPGTWDHSWSLAVEEHFYIFLPLFLILLMRVDEKREQPFAAIPLAFVSIAVLCVLFRAISVYVPPPNFNRPYIATHARMDALFFGVFLGYLHHFRGGTLERYLRSLPVRLALGGLAVLLLPTAYFFSRGDRFFATFGYSCLYLGFGCVLLLTIHVRHVLAQDLGRVLAVIGNWLAFIGMYSYSIYLWHGPVGAWGPGLVRRVFHISMGDNRRFVIYLVASLAVGILMSKLIEYPILRIRDRFFPSPQGRSVQMKTSGESIAPAFSSPT